ncbi:hypothetical protein F2S72_09050 [Pseudomonas syringae pv. actinidiae]|nr:hypothetical protein [Pseudomonas syringae pv. actinidiae]
MSKQITAAELAEIVNNLLTKPQSVGELEDGNTFACFMTEIAVVVCGFVGGDVKNQADNFTGEFLVGVHGNDSLPEGGGIWANYDQDGDLFA